MQADSMADPLVSNIFTKVSDRAKYTPPDATHVVQRKVTVLNPTVSSDLKYSGVKYVRFVLPAQDFLDTQRSYFSFQIVSTPAPGAPVGVDARGAWLQPYTDSAVFFKRLRIMVNSAQVEEIDDYNILQSVFVRYANDDGMYKSGLGAAMGMVPPELHKKNIAYASQIKSMSTALSQDGDNISTYVFHPSLLGFMNTHKYMPLQFMGEVTIELQLDDPRTCFISGLNQPVDYTIKNMKYHGEFCRMSTAYLSSFEAALAESAVTFWFSTFHTYTNNLTSSKTDITLNHRGRNLKTLITVFRKDADTNKVDANSFAFERQTIKQYQARIGSKMFPDEPITISATDYSVWMSETSKALGFWRNPYHTTSVPNSNVKDKDKAQFRSFIAANTTVFTNLSTLEPEGTYEAPDNNFIIAVDFEKEPELLSGEDTASSNVPIYLRIEGDVLTGVQAKTFIHQDVTMSLRATRDVVVVS